MKKTGSPYKYFTIALTLSLVIIMNDVLKKIYVTIKRKHSAKNTPLCVTVEPYPFHKYVDPHIQRFAGEGKYVTTKIGVFEKESTDAQRDFITSVYSLEMKS